MKKIRMHRKPLFLFAMITIVACGPQIVYHNSEMLLRGDEPLWENEQNSLEYGYRDSRYIRRIWPKKEPAVITAMGDVALNFAVMKDILDYRARKYGAADAMKYPFSRVRSEIKGIGFCNLEAPVTGYEMKMFNDKDEIFYFKSPPGSEKILEHAGIDIASLANNHIKDCGEKGMFDTRKRLAEKNIAPVGVGKNIEEALKPVYMWHRGTRVAFFAFNRVIPRSVWAGPTRPGAAGGSDELLCQAVRSVKGQADAVVVSIHWGKEVVRDYPVEKPEPEQVAFAHKLIDAGVTVILGHQSHALGPVERYGNGVVFYSLGDFVFAGRHSASHRTGMMVRVSVSERGLESYSIIPVNINPLDISYRPEILDRRKGYPVIKRVLAKRDDRYKNYYSASKIAKK